MPQKRGNLPFNGSWGTQLLLLALAALGTISCRQEATQTAPPRPVLQFLAQVGSSTISLEQFQAELNQRSQVSPERYASPEAIQGLLEELILTEVLHQRALAEGYESNPEIVASLKRMIIHKFEEDRLGDGSASTVNDAEVVAFYQDHPEDFCIPEQRLGAVIFFRVPETAAPELVEERRDKMNAIRFQAIKDAEQGPVRRGFGLLAQRNSEDQATRYRGGEMGWLSADQVNGRWKAPVSEALFALPEAGGISPVITAAKGLYLVKAIDIRPASMKSIQSVRDGILYRLGREKERQRRDAFYAAQKAQVTIQTNLVLFDSVTLPISRSQARPPGVPGS